MLILAGYTYGEQDFAELYNQNKATAETDDLSEIIYELSNSVDHLGYTSGEGSEIAQIENYIKDHPEYKHETNKIK